MPRKKTYSTLEVTTRNGIGIVSLNRPDVHNAFDEVLIAELTAAVNALAKDNEVRAIILTGNGPSFCAGADLTWMKKMAGFSRRQNVADAAALAQMLRTLNEVPKPTVARIHGNVFGGGVGLVACCDVAIAAAESTFSLSEAKLGLIPATISPYVIEAIGARQARRYFLTAERFEAAEAYRIGLVHDIVPQGQLDERVNELLGALLLAGPVAQAECKALIRAVAHRPIGDEMIADSVERIATVRASAEGKEGVGAFLRKRSPSWIPAELRKDK
jgi:methylglutaconyl-CoA hydratase